MEFNQNKNLDFYTFSNIKSNLKHAVFTRRGGISPAPWNSLNIGSTVGDDPQRVSKNRSSLLDAMNIDKSEIYECWQVHGSKVINAVGPRKLNSPFHKADAIITNVPGISLLMRFADCAPIFLFDPKKHVIGIVHAGWKGTVKKVAKCAVDRMVQWYGTNPIDIIAGIGPSIGPDHYEVGDEVISRVRAVFRTESEKLLKQINGKSNFDLWEANRLVLEKCGVRNIEVSGLCTACDLSNWFSHRAENGKTGRFGAIISL